MEEKFEEKNSKNRSKKVSTKTKGRKGSKDESSSATVESQPLEKIGKNETENSSAEVAEKTKLKKGSKKSSNISSTNTFPELEILEVYIGTPQTAATSSRGRKIKSTKHVQNPSKTPKEGITSAELDLKQEQGLKKQLKTKKPKDIKPENPDNPVDTESFNIVGVSSASSMSTYELISNPGTLKGGMGLFRQRVDNKIDSKEFEKRLQRSNFRKTEDENREPRTRSHSKRTLTNLNSGDPVGGKRLRSTEPVRPNISAWKLNKRREGELFHKAGGGPTASQLSTSNSEADVSTSQSLSQEDELDHGSVAEEDDQCEAQFGELFKRFIKPTSEYYEDEFDLSNRGQLMRSVFEDYDVKAKFYETHAGNVRDLPDAKLDKQFRKVKGDILDIFEGRLQTTRMNLYCSEDQGDRQRLRGLNVADPFDNQQGMTLASHLFEFLLPEPESRMKYNTFIKLVMLPETLLRIYAGVNKITLDMAEKEMKWGPRYDGPIPNDWYPKSEKKSVQTSS